ncbi:putative ribonuclease H protein-like [Capsicum annuum]|nr:putative ribonuclease H protein-like [Capsicum annuum]
MLRSFDFDGNITSIFLKNAPLLVKVSLKGYGMNAEDLNFAKVFESCPALEHLILDFTYAEFFAEEGYEAPTRLPFDLSVKRLYLYMLMRSSKLSYALCLIRSSPYLESLEIQAHGRAKNDDRIVKSLELEHFSDVTFNHLREVKLRCLSGTAPEMQLIKLLLVKSPELVRMLIDIQVDVPLEARLKIHAEVSNFLRASPEAEVVYEKIECHIHLSV